MAVDIIKISRNLIAVYLILLDSIAFSQVLCHGKAVLLTENGQCNPSPYVLVFEDNFDGVSLDTSKWQIAKGVDRDYQHKIAQQWYSPANIEVSNGTLKLITKRDTLRSQCYIKYINNGAQAVCENFFYTAGQIETHQKFWHCKIEISCKIPKAKGVGSSFWTYGEESNEIDVFEFENETNIFGKYDGDKLARVQNMNSHASENGNNIMCASHYTGPDFSKDFHIFTVVWTPHKLEWFLDGKSKRISTLFYTMQGQMVDCNGLLETNQYILNLSFPRYPMRIIFDNIVQSGSKAPDKNTEFPNYYEIDYIRIYKQMY
jgi:beta-glucanase (GH16 family)